MLLRNIVWACYIISVGDHQLFLLLVVLINLRLFLFFLQCHALPTPAVSCWWGTGDKTELDLLMGRQTTRNRWQKCVRQRSTTLLPCPLSQCSLIQGIKDVSFDILTFLYACLTAVLIFLKFIRSHACNFTFKGSLILDSSYRYDKIHISITVIFAQSLS